MPMAPAPAPASDRKRLDGVWLDGVWLCNCTPRKEAILRKVRRNTPNKGKFFWTCPAYPYCDFFLWRDDARLRGTGLLPASQPDGEPPPPPKTPVLTQRLITACGVSVSPGRRPGDGGGGGSKPADTVAVATQCPTPSKRKRDVFEEVEEVVVVEDDDDDDDDDEIGDLGSSDEFSDLGSDDERQLADLADRSADDERRHAVPPVPSVARTLFRAPDAKRPKTVSFEEPPPLGLPTPAKTPAAPRTSPPLPPDGDDGAIADDAIADHVMALLAAQPVAPAARAAVRARLAAAARATRGLVLGRAAARDALRLRDQEVAALRRRVADLERRDALLNSQLTNIKAQLMKVYEDN